MLGIREKYSKQMGLFYKDEEHKMGKNLKNGASIAMMLNPNVSDLGRSGRSLFLEMMAPLAHTCCGSSFSASPPGPNIGIES